MADEQDGGERSDIDRWWAEFLILDTSPPTPGAAERLLALASRFESAQHHDAALEICQRAVDLDQASAEAKFRLGRQCHDAGYPPRFTEALIRRAVDLDPVNPHYRVGLISLLIQFDRFEEAFTYAMMLVPAEIDQITCECCLGRIASLLHSFGDHALAICCERRLSVLAKVVDPIA